MLRRHGSMGAMLFGCAIQRRRKPLQRQYQHQQQRQLKAKSSVPFHRDKT